MQKTPYQNSLRQRQQLVLSEYEVIFCKLAGLTWALVAATALASCVAAPLLGEQTQWSGLVYFSLSVTMPVARGLYQKSVGIAGLHKEVKSS
ncbi:hypothetical protein OAM75_03385 [Gammaproteobacteria bacterium]|nr:hypothetical protein [Pseudomonadales bacterium]MDC0413990.1 hypothetical protein [Gammaproteobacteria bacterium]